MSNLKKNNERINPKIPILKLVNEMYIYALYNVSI